MPYIMNCLEDEVRTQAHGKWFTFKPQEIKVLHNESLARFMAERRAEEGLVEVPEHVQEMDKTSEQYKAAIYELRKNGIMRFVGKQNSVVRNLEISLRGDYERSGQKGNFLFEASRGELQAYKNLKKYKEFEAKEQMNVADEIQKIREDIYGDGSTRPAAEALPEVTNPLKK